MLVLGDGEVVSLTPGSRITPGQREAVDVCFVFDTTGSMRGIIDGLVESTSHLVAELDDLRLRWRTSVVPFGDLRVPGERVEADLPFVSEAQDGIQQLQTMPKFWGGSNHGESAIAAMLAALGKPFMADAVPCLILLTNEPAYVTDQESHETVDAALRAADALC